ncbi:putative callose synthase 1 catalytic subunit [Sesbania bispinosa]|nr:putative callose synthase 1 catalytic subunit [Sesbania bispinosa]
MGEEGKKEWLCGGMGRKMTVREGNGAKAGATDGLQGSGRATDLVYDDLNGAVVRAVVAFIGRPKQSGTVVGDIAR